MTTREILDSFSETLMCDDRILSVQEKELLANLLQRARTNASARDPAVAEAIARAVGETIAQRAYGILGNSIAQRLVAQQSGSAVGESGTEAIVFHSGGPGPPGPKGPGPPSPLKGPGPPGPKGPGPPSPLRGPGLPTPGLGGQAQASPVAVLGAIQHLEPQCVVLDEFLAPEELNEVMRYTGEHEADFRISEVVSPGVGGAVVDYDHRKSRVLVDLGKHQEVIGNRIQACLPRVLQKLGCDLFPVAKVEAQITASNHGDFFGHHLDNDHELTASRELTFVYFFHREPKAFDGGNLRIYHMRRENGEYVSTGNYQNIVPEQNQMVLFLSSLLHEITPVECPSGAFADSRFTVNGWLHR
jgi:hypothetical protein